MCHITPRMVQETTPVRDRRAPSKLLWAAELPRAALTVLSLIRARASLADLPRGDGRPILLLPGLFNADRSNFVLRRYLNDLGYRAEGWGLGRNTGVRVVGPEAERLFDRIRALHAETGQPVTLIGISLGGIMARLAAQRLPGMIREVITVSSPFAGSPRATNVWRAFEWFTGERIDSDAVRLRSAEAAAPLPVRSTAIWSRSDGLVNGRICRSDGDPRARDIEIRSGHLGVQLHPQTLRAIAGILAAG